MFLGTDSKRAASPEEAEVAKWLTKETIDSVQWLPVDITFIDKIKAALK